MEFQCDSPDHVRQKQPDVTYYRALLDVTNVLNSQRDTEGLWKTITGYIKKVIPWERAGITLYDPERDAFQFYAVETRLPKILLKRNTTIPREGSAIGWVYEHRRMHIRPNLQVERLFFEDQFYYEEGLGRMINLPLIIRDTCIGTLNIGSVESGLPGANDVEFLQQVAKQIALAIDNVLAYEQLNVLKRQLSEENQYLTEEIKASHNFGAMVGNSPALREVQELAQAVASRDTTVLITGETGTGKELLARLIHELSPRQDGPFIRVNCAGFPPGLVESELFGYERGAFTGADSRRLGRFELAHGGTLFLDEIGEMPWEAQSKLLRVLQDGLVDRLGGTQSIPVDVRIIAATNSDLNALINKGEFRSDLFYRLNVFPIYIPPLRERPTDISLLVRHFIAQYSSKLRRNPPAIEQKTLELLLKYQWPGNVRELQNIIERAMILTTGQELVLGRRFLGLSEDEEEPSSNHLHSLEKSEILRVLKLCNWKINGLNGAARRLGLNPSTLRSRMKKMQISRTAVWTLGWNPTWAYPFLFSLTEILTSS